jgi:hypothetical protein
LCLHAQYARVLRIGECGLRLQRLEIGLLHGHIQPHQHCAGLDDLPWNQGHSTHRAGKFIANADGLRSHDRADGCRARPVLALFGDRNLDGFDRLGLLGRGGVRIFQRGLFPGRE